MTWKRFNLTPSLLLILLMYGPKAKFEPRFTPRMFFAWIVKYFLIILKIVMFPFEIILFGNNRQTTFQIFLLSQTFLSSKLLKYFFLLYSLFLLQKSQTWMSLFIVFTFIVISPNFQKHIPKLCSLYNDFIHKRRMITSDILPFSKSTPSWLFFG